MKFPPGLHICLFNSAYIKNFFYKETQTVEKKESNQIKALTSFSFPLPSLSGKLHCC